MPALREQFDDLFAYVLTLKERLRTREGPQPTYQEVWTYITSTLDEKRREVAEQPEMLQRFEAARYAFNAWADETLTNLPWQDAATWKDNPLQREYDNTIRAGTEGRELRHSKSYGIYRFKMMCMKSITISSVWVLEWRIRT
ncbi:hypothetical protein C2W62_27800 [Candidatus Entotheonella serta]|nr:hypothetical protein C2W62_27800 [Candidatus Entotheonella serta]